MRVWAATKILISLNHPRPWIGIEIILSALFFGVIMTVSPFTFTFERFNLENFLPSGSQISVTTLHHRAPAYFTFFFFYYSLGCCFPLPLITSLLKSYAIALVLTPKPFSRSFPLLSVSHESFRSIVSRVLSPGCSKSVLKVSIIK